MSIFKTDPFIDIANSGLNLVVSSMNFSGMVVNVGSLSSYAGVTALITDIQDGLQSIALAIVITFFLFSVFSDAMNETFALERFFKSFARLAAGIGMINLSGELTKLGDGIGGWVQEKVGDITSKKVTNTQFTKDDFDGFWVALIVCAIVFLVSIIASFFIRIAFYFILFSRLIEMAIRAAFMPIAVAMVTDGGWAGSAGRYIKKYIALCMQGPALVLIGRISAQLMEGAAKVVENGDGLTGFIAGVFQLGGVVPVIAVAAATIGLAKQSITILNDVMGV